MTLNHPFPAQVDGALAGEQGRFEAGRALELRGALLEYAATNLGFVKRNAATWHQLKDAMQPTDVEVKASLARVPVWKSTSGMDTSSKTSNLSISVTSKSIRLIFGRIDCSRRVLEAPQKALRRNGRIRSH